MSFPSSVVATTSVVVSCLAASYTGPLRDSHRNALGENHHIPTDVVTEKPEVEYFNAKAEHISGTWAEEHIERSSG